MRFEGHGSDVKSCHWHPFQTLLATGSKDNKLKLWDPRNGREIESLSPHNNTINQVRFNPVNGHWLLTGSRDCSLKLHDVRMLKPDGVRSFLGHQDQVTVAAWHPSREELFASASHDGQISYWLSNHGGLHHVPQAHSTMVWGLAWHPEGKSIASTGNDHKIKFWGRLRPHDKM